MASTALDKTTRSNDHTNDAHASKDPFGFDLAARCFTEQVRDSMAKISTFDANAKTSEMLKAEQQQPPAVKDAKLQAALLTGLDKKNTQALYGDIAEEKTFGKVLAA